MKVYFLRIQVEICKAFNRLVVLDKALSLEEFKALTRCKPFTSSTM